MLFDILTMILFDFHLRVEYLEPLSFIPWKSHLRLLLGLNLKLTTLTHMEYVHYNAPFTE